MARDIACIGPVLCHIHHRLEIHLSGPFLARPSVGRTANRMVPSPAIWPEIYQRHTSDAGRSLLEVLEARPPICNAQFLPGSHRDASSIDDQRLFTGARREYQPLCRAVGVHGYSIYGRRGHLHASLPSRDCGQSVDEEITALDC